MSQFDEQDEFDEDIFWKSGEKAQGFKKEVEKAKP